MVETASEMAPLGMDAPPFSLPDVTSGETVTLDHFRGADGLLVAFICAHCPFVKHVEDELAALADNYADGGIQVVGISSNDIGSHPQDAPERLAEQGARVGFHFPYLFDESQEVAKAYSAACTPDFYLFDGDFRLFYRGQLDDSRPRNGVPVTGRDLRNAMDRLLAGDDPPGEQRPSMGCNIKWRPGNRPDYFG